MTRKQLGILLLTATLTGGSLLNAPAAIGNVYAKEITHSTETSVAPMEVMDFLNICSPKDQINITVTQDQAKEMMEVINQVTKDAKTEYERAQAIYNWIANNVTYTSNQATAISSSPYEVFTQKQAVCGGYSNLIKEMMNLAGIPAVCLVGFYGGDLNVGYAHQWSAVFVDGRWVYCDGTAKGFFDHKSIPGTHFAKEVTDTYITYNGLKLGYYYGLAVVGSESSSVVIPDTYYDYPITSVSYALFSGSSSVEELSFGKYVTKIDESTLRSHAGLRSISVGEGNSVYASSQGALFSSDFSQLLVYPLGAQIGDFTLPKETKSFDIKEGIRSEALQNIYVEAGNSDFASFDGALYNSDYSELLLIPQQKTELTVYKDAKISDTAFANFDSSKITLIVAPGSPAGEYAKARNINFIEKCSHKLTKVEGSEATCTEPGYKDYFSCDNCSQIFSDEKGEHLTEIDSLKIPTSPHRLGDLISVRPVTCTTAGLEVSECMDCGHKQEYEIPTEKAQHCFGDWKEDKAATCNSHGTLSRTCLNCDHTESKTADTPLPEHQFGPWYLTVPATEKESGKEIRFCKICAYSETKEIHYHSK